MTLCEELSKKSQQRGLNAKYVANGLVAKRERAILDQRFRADQIQIGGGSKWEIPTGSTEHT